MILCAILSNHWLHTIILDITSYFVEEKEESILYGDLALGMTS